MGKVSIELEDSAFTAGPSYVQRVAISNMRSGSLLLPADGLTLARSRGVILVIPPQGMRAPLLACGSIRLFSGTCLVLDGKNRNRIEHAPDSEDLAVTTTVGILDLTARIDLSATLADCLALPALLDSRTSSQIATLYEEIRHFENSPATPSDADNLALHLQACTLVSRLLQAASNADTQILTHIPPAERLKRLMASELSKKHTATEMARRFNMSRSGFTNWAKRVLGTTPALYRRKMRLEHSQALLQNDALSVEQVSQMTGFVDRYHFDREFKKAFGLSPAKYRKALQEKSREASPYDMFRHNRFKKSLELCDKMLAIEMDDAERQKLLYLRVQCLSAVGQNEEAAKASSLLKESAVAQRAGLQLAQSFFEQQHYDKALEQLELVCAGGDPSSRQAVGQAWLDQFNALAAERLVQPLRHYAEMRLRCLGDDLYTAQRARMALTQIGDNRGALQHSACSAAQQAEAYFSMGCFSAALKHAPPQTRPRLALRCLVKQARHQDVLDSPNASDSQRAGALVALGRPEEAVLRYPADASAAYFVLGRYEEILSLDRTHTEWKIYALHALGRTDSLRSFKAHGTWFWHIARLYCAPASLLHVTSAENAEFLHHARLLSLLNALTARQGGRADEILAMVQTIDDIGFVFGDHRTTEIITSAALRSFLSQPHILRETLQQLTKRFRYTGFQKCWYAARYLLGLIDDKRFLAQPLQVSIADRLRYLKAIKEDTGGNRRKARNAYRRFLEQSMPYEFDLLLMHRFAEWRLKEMA